MCMKSNEKYVWKKMFVQHGSYTCKIYLVENLLLGTAQKCERNYN